MGEPVDSAWARSACATLARAALSAGSRLATSPTSTAPINPCAALLTGSMAWLDAREAGDDEAEADALGVLTDVLPWHPNFDEDGREMFQEKASRAAQGDPTLVAAYVEESDCADLPFTSTAENDGDRTWADHECQERYENAACFEIDASGESTPCYPGTPVPVAD